jgi:rare lipoprotein A (peptidoglycan hydrolase)
MACLVGLSLIGGPGGAGSNGLSALQSRVFSGFFESVPRAAVQMKAVQAEVCYSAVMAVAVLPNPQPLPPPPSPPPAPPPSPAPQAPVTAPLSVAPPAGNAPVTYGIATWYGGVDGFDLGDGMADGSPFNPDDPTIAASNQWPLGARLLVCHGERCIQVCVHDRGAFSHSLDLSRGAFALLAPLGTGVIDVVVQRIS